MRSPDEFQYIREYYGVEARLGQRVTYRGDGGVITGTSGPHLMMRLDGERIAKPYHPLDLQFPTLASRSR